MRAIPSESLVIGIASSPAERRQLARLLGGTEAFLIVSTVQQAREFLDAAGAPAAAAAGQPAIVDATEEMGPPPPPELIVDSDRRVLRWLDREIDLTPLEHDFLVCLVGTPGQVWTYEQLHLKVWGNEHLGRGSDMHSVVRRVRRKLARLDASAAIHAVRGVGFRLALA
ncbi:winged helix-turn-helix domain-containing protein [Micromonospora sp. DR5-3]|uniref:winged helix-turn-helix domain-containing protein n=1 Tax=unclassified Micromonospora TaxID=2617518 RepID=UPI0011D53DA3|nr:MULTISPECIES: winged helix-turn-helix domain-containing protein [unclassified Micromonospora]MCW3814038.1 winged helix-turn-helix domain-containing protein [Micromonospora sp. DR5-3]TYC23609.1 winged helix-turn-helix transcriptional regulator [Micromonospora sp. MP36]